MALSGSFEKSVNTYWRLRAEWSATQNISGNSSRVTVKLYWMADRAGVGRVTASSPDPVSITINGDTSPAATATPYLSEGEKKLIRTFSVTVPHNSDGTKTFSMSASFTVDAYLYNGNVSTVSISDSATLNTIPRASKLATSPSWVAGSDKTTAITRYSSSFSHKVRYYVMNRAGSWIEIAEVIYSTSQTSRSSDFTTDQKQKIFDALDGRSEADSRIVVDTLKSGVLIGDYRDDGKVTAPASTIVNSGSFDNSVYTNQEIYIPLTRQDTEFTHTVRVKLGTYTKTFTGVTTSVRWTPTTTEQTSLNAQIPVDKKSLAGSVEVDTFYNGSSERVQGTKSATLTFTIRGTEPTFTGSLTYADVNTAVLNGKPATTPLTGNPALIIAKKSRVQARVPVDSKATANGGSAMASYTATLAGKTITKPYSSSADVVFDFNEIDAKTNQTLVVRAIDKRGFSSMLTKIVTIIPYEPPGISASALRNGGFEKQTILRLSGTLSRVDVGGVAKNAMVSAQYRNKLSGSLAWSTYTNFAVTGFPGFTATDIEVLMDIMNSYEVEFKVTDKLGSTTLIRSVGSGRPLMFFDDKLGAVGAGDFPQAVNEFLMSMTLRFKDGQFGRGKAGVDLNKANVVGFNALFSADEQTGSEGFNFLKPGKTPGSTDFADYDNFRLNGGVAYVNGIPMNVPESSRIVWEGAAYPNPDPYSVPLGRQLMDFPNGIVLVFSEYVVGTGAVNAGYQTYVVPKEIIPIPGTGMKFPLMDASNNTIYKYLYFNGDNITAGAQASTGTARNMVLRYIIGY